MNSSKKSSRQFQSPPDPRADNRSNKSKPTPQASPGGAPRPGLESMPDRPFSTGGKYIKIPTGNGMELYFESRQVGLLFLSLVLYIFAAFVASDSIYLLSAGFLTAVVLGVALPFISLYGIQATYAMPHDLSQMQAASIRLHLRRTLPFGVLSALVPTRALRLSLTVVKRAPDGKPSSVVLKPDPCYVEKLIADEWFSFPTPELKRGIYFMESVEISTCFPFGISWWSRTISLKEAQGEGDSTITIYPITYAMTSNFLSNLSGIVSPMGQATSSSVIVHQSSSFRSVREFKSGDSLRHIHWASSARLGRFLVREFDSETLPIFDVMLNLRSNYRNDEQFELTVNLVNSLVNLGHNLGHMPRLIINPPVESNDVQSLMFDLPQMPPGLGLVAEILARVEPITKIAANKMSFDEVEEVIDYREAWSHVSDRPILTIVPSGDKIMKYAPGKGDIVCCPVDILEVPPNWAELEGFGDEESSADFKAARGGAKKSKTVEFGPTAGKMIARVEWEGDFESL